MKSKNRSTTKRPYKNISRPKPTPKSPKVGFKCPKPIMSISIGGDDCDCPPPVPVPSVIAPPPTLPLTTPAPIPVPPEIIDMETKYTDNFYENTAITLIEQKRTINSDLTVLCQGKPTIDTTFLDQFSLLLGQLNNLNKSLIELQSQYDMVCNILSYSTKPLYPTTADFDVAEFLKRLSLFHPGPFVRSIAKSEDVVTAVALRDITVTSPVATPSVEVTSTDMDDKFAKFVKMRKMLPEGAVRQKMTQEGFSNLEIENFWKNDATTTPSTASTGPVMDETFRKYEKMRKMLPEGAVRQKMAQDSISDTEIDRFWRLVASGAKLVESSVEAETSVTVAPPVPTPRPKIIAVIPTVRHLDSILSEIDIYISSIKVIKPEKPKTSGLDQSISIKESEVGFKSNDLATFINSVEKAKYTSDGGASPYDMRKTLYETLIPNHFENIDYQTLNRILNEKWLLQLPYKFLFKELNKTYTDNNDIVKCVEDIQNSRATQETLDKIRPVFLEFVKEYGKITEKEQKDLLSMTKLVDNVNLYRVLIDIKNDQNPLRDCFKTDSFIKGELPLYIQFYKFLSGPDDSLTIDSMYVLMYIITKLNSNELTLKTINHYYNDTVSQVKQYIDIFYDKKLVSQFFEKFNKWDYSTSKTIPSSLRPAFKETKIKIDNYLKRIEKVTKLKEQLQKLPDTIPDKDSTLILIEDTMLPEHRYPGAIKSVEEMSNFVVSFPSSAEYKEFLQSKTVISDKKYNFNLETIYKNFKSFITYMWREISPIVIEENYRITNDPKNKIKVNENFTTFKKQYVHLEQKINKLIEQKKQNSLILFKSIDFGLTSPVEKSSATAIKKLMTKFE